MGAHLEDVLVAFMRGMDEDWERILDSFGDPNIVRGKDASFNYKYSDWDKLEKRCLQVMTARELSLHAIYTRYTKSLRLITIIMNGLFLDGRNEMEIDSDLRRIRVLSFIKYIVEENTYGIFHPVIRRVLVWRKDEEMRRLWMRVGCFEAMRSNATGDRLLLPVPPPPHLGYVSGASDTESEAGELDSDSSSSDDSDATETNRDDFSSRPGPHRCRCCEYCPNESTLVQCPFSNITDERREEIMTIFERRRSPNNQALMNQLREEKSEYRLCVKLMESLKGSLNYVEVEGYLPASLQLLREEDGQRAR